MHSAKLKIILWQSRWNKIKLYLHFLPALCKYSRPAAPRQCTNHEAVSRQQTVRRIAMISGSAYHFHPHNVHDMMMMNCRMDPVSARSALPFFRSTVCTGRLMPASRRPKPSSPPESCPIRPYARQLPTPLPPLPRGPSTRLDREGREGMAE